MAKLIFSTQKEHDDFIEGLNKLDNIKKQVLEAYRLSRQNISKACEVTQTPRATWYYWRQTDWIFRKAVELQDEIRGDEVEQRINELMMGRKKKLISLKTGKPIKRNGKEVELDEYEVPPHPSMLMFYAKTKLKDRGYTEMPMGKDGDDEGNPNDNMKPLIVDWRDGIED